jgi:ABC-type branched-subunit amino acid transport system ATPase component/ABC-type branched-subunit amino acid transport system permease subunit
MTKFIEFAILGLGLSAAYSLLSLGLVVIYRGSGVLNVAQGAFAYFGGTMYYTFVTDFHWPKAVAAIAAVVCGGALGVATNQFVMRPMTRASYLTRLIATLGLMVFIENFIDWRINNGYYEVKGLLPISPVKLFNGVTVGKDQLILFGIAVVLTAVMYYIYRQTRFGLITSSVAANEQAAASLGHSPNLIANINWAVGGCLGALAGVFLAPLIGVAPNTMTLLIVPALACALIGGFKSFGYVLLAAVAIGVAQSEFNYYVPSVEGLSYALPFLFIVLIPFFRGEVIPGRGHVVSRLPMVGAGGFRWKVVLPLVVVAAVLAHLLNSTWQTAFAISCIGIVLGLSVVLVTGYAGQLSLAQFALAGVAAWVTGQATIHIGLPFWAALIVGPLVTIPVGVLIGIPSLRMRGVGLAIATLGFAVVAENMLFSNGSLTGGLGGMNVGHIHFVGWDIYPVGHPWRYGLVCLGGALVSGFLVATVRRSATGRRLLAVRSNERAAASLGIEPGRFKLYAFAVSAGIAGLGGVLFAFQEPNILFSSFTSLESITLILYVVLAGIGFVTGGVLTGLLFTGGLMGQIAIELFHSGQLYQAIASLFLVFSIVFNADGLIRINIEQYEWIRGKVVERLGRPQPAVPALAAAGAGRAPVAAMPSDEVPAAAEATPVDASVVGRGNRLGATAREGAPTPSPVPGRGEGAPVLEISGLTVRFGGVTAISDLSFSIHAGEVVGLIGANGAGKTTVIDAISGFVPRYTGQIRLDGAEMEGHGATDRANRGIRRTFQSLELFEDMSVLDNVTTSCEPYSLGNFTRDLVAPVPPELSDEAHIAIDEFHLASELARRPDELSYGDRKVAAIVRAVAMPSKLLLLDEPTAGLDTVESRELGALVQEFASSRGVAVLLVEHDVDLVASVCDRILALDFGKKIAEGTPGEIMASDAVRNAYLGVEVEPVTLEGS